MPRLDVRTQFPLLAQPTPQGTELAYLDNASTTQKPQRVLDAMTRLYTSRYANVGRGLYWPATEANLAYSHARETVAQFIGAPKDSVVFTAGTTDSINRVAHGFLLPRLQPDQEVVITILEHHANFIPWQQVCKRAGAKLRVVGLNAEGGIDMDELAAMLSERTALLAFSAVSNVLGTITPVEQVVAMAKKYHIPVLVDAAQQVGHSQMDVSRWDADFVAFSAHKAYGPTGIGVLYGKPEHLQAMEPLHFGGGAIRSVSLTDTLLAEGPQRHEPGTPNLAGAVGIAEALDFLTEVGMNAVHDHLAEVTAYAHEELAKLEGLTIVGPPEPQGPVLSLKVGEVHPHDVASFLASMSIGIRAGHHCAQPLMDHLQLPGTVRASFGIYTTHQEIDRLVAGLKQVLEFFE